MDLKDDSPTQAMDEKERKSQSAMERISVVRSVPRRAQRSLSGLFAESDEAHRHPAPPESPVGSVAEATGSIGDGRSGLRWGSRGRPDWLKEEMFREADNEGQETTSDVDGDGDGAKELSLQEPEAMMPQTTGTSVGSSAASSAEEGLGASARSTGWGGLSLSSLSSLVWRESSTGGAVPATGEESDRGSVAGSVKSNFSLGLGLTSDSSGAAVAGGSSSGLWGWLSSSKPEDGSAAMLVIRVAE